MLETRIEELTSAVKALTEMMSVRVTLQPAPVDVMAHNAKVLEDQNRATALTPSQSRDMQEYEAPKKPKKPKKETAKTPEPVAQTITDTSPLSESESAPVTYDDVKKATNALSTAKGRDVTIDALSRFGVKRATELDEVQWADYIAYTETVIADE
jgi:hypothetical protein